MAQGRFAIDALDRRPRGAPGRVVWLLLAGNHRPLGRSAAAFADNEEAAEDAAWLQRSLPLAEPVIARDRRSGEWQWTLNVEGVPAVLSPRRWAVQNGAQLGLARFLETAAVASLPEAGASDDLPANDLAPAPAVPAQGTGPTVVAVAVDDLEETFVDVDLRSQPWAALSAPDDIQSASLDSTSPLELSALRATGHERASVERVGTQVRGAQLDAVAVSAWFGSNRVLDKVSLSMPPGTVTALIGPSGCGKSTFLRILNRMHELVPSAKLAGEVRLDGEDIYAAGRRITETRKRIGMVFQKPNPFPSMSIYENVIAGLKLTGTKASMSEKDDLVEQCLRRGGLWTEVKDRLEELGSALSGGQQQRLCIARSLAVQPEVLLMDEPCSALDPTSTRRVEETIAELAEEVTIVIVTHNMQQAARVSQQSAFFLAEQGTPGRIVEAGETRQVFEDPIDPRTRDYVNGRFG